jgi:hypothetical protein
MNNNSQALVEIQFQKIGEWKLFNDELSIEYETNTSYILNLPNALYSFIISSNNDDLIGYIGKTSKSIKNRFQGYLNPGINQKTNIRVSNKIKETILLNKQVFIYVLIDIEPLQWGGFSINLPAGLEDSLVNNLKPIWNIAGVGNQRPVTSSEELEEENNIANNDSNNEVITSFKINLGEAYYNQGFMNPGVKASEYLGNHNEEVTIILSGNKKLKSKIDRTANPNGSVRLYFGKDLSEWYKRKYKLGDSLIAGIKQNNIIIIE